MIRRKCELSDILWLSRNALYVFNVWNTKLSEALHVCLIPACEGLLLIWFKVSGSAFSLSRVGHSLIRVHQLQRLANGERSLSLK